MLFLPHSLRLSSRVARDTPTPTRRLHRHQGEESSLGRHGFVPMDAPSPTINAQSAQPLPVVVTLESNPAACTSTNLISFTIPLREPQQPPSWQELLGHR